MNQLNEAARKRLVKAFKKAFSDGEDPLQRRVNLRERIKESAIGGTIGIDWSATDCDMTQCGGHSHCPATVMHLERWENNFYEGAEGPQNAFIVRPRDSNNAPWRRDLALEAFEDGHPHVVHL